MHFELKERYEKIIYTLKHKLAFLKVEKQLRGKNTLHGYLHDLDKPFLYMAFWIKLKDVQKIHRHHSKHHIHNNLKKSNEDLIDTIIDWECARMTKPDKPLNAYETLMKFYPEYQNTFLPLICKFLPEQIKSRSTFSEKASDTICCEKDRLLISQPIVHKTSIPLFFQKNLNKKSR